jgi:hypothetical protein
MAASRLVIKAAYQVTIKNLTMTMNYRTSSGIAAIITLNISLRVHEHRHMPRAHDESIVLAGCDISDDKKVQA